MGKVEGKHPDGAYLIGDSVHRAGQICSLGARVTEAKIHSVPAPRTRKPEDEKDDLDEPSGPGLLRQVVGRLPDFLRQAGQRRRQGCKMLLVCAIRVAILSGSGFFFGEAAAEGVGRRCRSIQPRIAGSSRAAAIPRPAAAGSPV